MPQGYLPPEPLQKEATDFLVGLRAIFRGPQLTVGSGLNSQAWIRLSVERPEGIFAPVSKHSTRCLLEPEGRKVVAYLEKDPLLKLHFFE